MKTTNLVMVGCCLALIGSAACSAGVNGIDGAQGPAGSQGPTGPQGPAGSDGTNGANGSNGEAGATGATGAQGDQGETGAQGQQGDTGAQGQQGQQGDTGAQGDAGVSLCGDVPMPQWHQACGSDLTQVCQDVGLVGEWECHLFLSSPDQNGDVTESQKIVCADSTSHKTLAVPASSPALVAEYPGNASVFSVDDSSVLPAADTFGSACGSDLLGVCAVDSASWSCLSGKAGCVSGDTFVKVASSQASEYPNSCVSSYVASDCNDTAACDGTVDTTANGANVTYVKQASIIEVGGYPVGAGDGICRNAAKRCLPDGTTVGHSATQADVLDSNNEGVLWGDFTPATHEADLGFECVGADGVSVLTYACTVGDNGVASVTCTGPRGI